MQADSAANPQQYFPKDIMNKLQGREAPERSIHSLHADPYSEVLLVLANAYASLTYLEKSNINQKDEKQKQIKTDYLDNFLIYDECLINVFLVGEFWVQLILLNVYDHVCHII